MWFFLVITLFTSGDARYIEKSSSSENFLPTDKICLTPGCVEAAARVISFIDESVDPCDDFYKFACGGWLEKHSIPEDESSVSVDTEIKENLNLQLKILLERTPSEEDPPFAPMLKAMYDSCMDLETIEKSGTEPLRRDLEKLGGWPAVVGYDWNGETFDWIDMLVRFRELGYEHNILMQLSVYTDLKNKKVNILYLDQPPLGIPSGADSKDGLDDPFIAAYFNLMVESAKALGADENTVEKELLKALHFEIALSNISVPAEERRDMSELYNKYTVQELINDFPEIPWLKFLNGLLADEVAKNETLILLAPNFISKFSYLITYTEKRVLANYMIWRTVFASSTEMSKEWRDFIHEYSSVVYGVSKEKPRWFQCLSSLENTFGLALGSYYVRHYFDAQSKVAALEMFRYIQQVFKKMLEEIDWMDEKTKEAAIDKAGTIRAYMGYPEELLNDTAVMELYDKLTISSNNYFDNLRHLQKWAHDKSYAQLRKLNNKEKWETHGYSAVVNAAYHSDENVIDIPAGILQGVYFDKDEPHYMNFGGIGYVIGHEITHGFDDMGRQFDKHGHNVNWWEAATDLLFIQKKQCIIDQYSSYTAENGMKVNGIITQGENIADNGGLKEAYWAYRAWVKDNGDDGILPGLKYSQHQLFWISAAHTYCGKDRPEALKDQILSDPHSPNQFRVIGPMSNIPEFSEDFKCPLGSPMNKKNKCEVW